MSKYTVREDELVDWALHMKKLSSTLDKKLNYLRMKAISHKVGTVGRDMIDDELAEAKVLIDSTKYHVINIEAIRKGN